MASAILLNPRAKKKRSRAKGSASRKGKRRRNPIFFASTPSRGRKSRKRRSRRNPFRVARRSLGSSAGLVRSVIAGVAGYYITKGVTLGVGAKLAAKFAPANWRETATTAAAAAAAFAVAALGRMTGFAKGDLAKPVALGGLLYSVNRGIEKSGVVSGLKAGFTKDLLSGDDDDLSDFVMADGSDGWQGQIDSDLQSDPRIGVSAFLGDFVYAGGE